MDQPAMDRRVVEQFRAGGPVDGMHRARLLLLATVGARTGGQRAAPHPFVLEHAGRAGRAIPVVEVTRTD